MTFSKGKTISPILVGTNVWYIELSDEVWKLTEESGVTSIRIGGHAYDKQMPSNEQLIDWVKKIQSIGAEPILQVSQYAPPSDAKALVKLFNVDLVTGKAIKYWNIGNEPWLQNNKPAFSELGAMVETYFKPRSEIMKAVDPTIKIFGPDFCYYIDEAVNDLFGGKNDISGKIPGKDYFYCDGISWHRYPQDENINLAYEGIEDFERAIIKCKSKVDSVNVLHNRKGDIALGWGIGEYNAKGGPQVHTWENGQMFGGVLNLSMKYEATYATSWSMFEHGGDRKGSDFSFIDGTNMIPRPSYRHMQMIAKNFSGVYVDGTSSTKDIITFGSVDKNNTLHLNANKKLLCINHYRYGSFEYLYGIKEGRGGGVHKYKYKNNIKLIKSINDKFLPNDTYLRDKSEDIIHLCKENNSRPKIELYPNSRWLLLKNSNKEKYDEFKSWNNDNNILNHNQINEINNFINNI